MLFSRRYLLICSMTLVRGPRGNRIRWSGSTIQEMLENVRNFRGNGRGMRMTSREDLLCECCKEVECEGKMCDTCRLLALTSQASILG